ncbi:signal transduction histidine kinase [Actinophytocola oryzae]|uniref:histidine kinase n=2 Tax=Actinophytocola oryzae TaxID=502181 RepID=A0A4R7V5S7_9PSEU|nr:signal transduction histidine kinase [Actinophytocola oryzae]
MGRGRLVGFRRQGVAAFLVIALPLSLEVAGHWVELAVGLVVVGAAVTSFPRFPLALFSLAVVGVLVPTLVLAPIATSPVRGWPFLVAAVFGYLAARRLADQRSVVTALAGILLAGLPVGVLIDVGDRGAFGVLFGLYDWFVLVLLLLLAVGLPWLAGRYRRQRAELLVAGLERVAVTERARIARDMHDSLGHELGLVALRAAALQVAPHLDEHTRAEAGELRAGIAAATERLHEIVGLLGEPEGTDLTPLVARATAAGQTVELVAPGDPPPQVAAAVHRVVREGLTNAARHAPGTPVTVRVTTSGDRTTVTVENALSGVEAPGRNGFGIAGLREQVAVLGGTFDAGVRDGRFVVEAGLPHDTAVAPPGRDRPRLWRLARAPLLAAAVVVVLGIGLYLFVGSDNRLDPAVYGRLYLGQPQADVERVLPRFQILGDPERMLPTPRQGADCRQYWATVQTDDRLFYRLCFADQRLVVKETVPRSAVSR